MRERFTPLTVRTSARAGMFVQHKFGDNSREGIRTSRTLGDGSGQAGKRGGSAAAGATRRRQTHSLCVGLTAGGWPTRWRRADLQAPTGTERCRDISRKTRVQPPLSAPRSGSRRPARLPACVDARSPTKARRQTRRCDDVGRLGVAWRGQDVGACLVKTRSRPPLSVPRRVSSWPACSGLRRRTFLARLVV